MGQRNACAANTLQSLGGHACARFERKNTVGATHPAWCRADRLRRLIGMPSEEEAVEGHRTLIVSRHPRAPVPQQGPGGKLQRSACLHTRPASRQPRHPHLRASRAFRPGSDRGGGGKHSVTMGHLKPADDEAAAVRSSNPNARRRALAAGLNATAEAPGHNHDRREDR